MTRPLPGFKSLLASLVVATATWGCAQATRRADVPPPPSQKGGHARAVAPPLAPEALDTLRRINTYRAAGATCGNQRFGAAPPLAWHGALETAAARHAEDMARRRVMSHTGADGSEVSARVDRVGYAWWGVGENVSAGYATVPAALAGWMQSPGHCANMMKPDFTEVGVAGAYAPDDSFGWYRAMVLAKGRVAR